jgi:hypothetical protein
MILLFMICVGSSQAAQAMVVEPHPTAPPEPCCDITMVMMHGDVAAHSAPRDDVLEVSHHLKFILRWPVIDPVSRTMPLSATLPRPLWVQTGDLTINSFINFLSKKYTKIPLSQKSDENPRRT